MDYFFNSDLPLKSHTYISPFVRIGHLLLNGEVKEKFSDWVEVTSDERPERKDVKLHMGIYYHCDDVWNPEVGDIRVQFYYAGYGNEIVCCAPRGHSGGSHILNGYLTSLRHPAKDHKRSIFESIFSVGFGSSNAKKWGFSAIYDQ